MFYTGLFNRPKNGIRNSKGKDGGNTSKQVFQSYFYLCITGGTPSSFDLCKDISLKEKRGKNEAYYLVTKLMPVTSLRIQTRNKFLLQYYLKVIMSNPI